MYEYILLYGALYSFTFGCKPIHSQCAIVVVGAAAAADAALY